MNPQAFKRATGRLPQRSAPFAVPVPKVVKVGPEAMYHYWYPGREGVERCPTHFAVRLAEISPDLAIVKPPPQAPVPTRPWLVWYRKPSVTYWLSPGWMLLFAWQTREGVPLPLDTRVFANLYRISARAFGSGAAYFQSIVDTMQAEKAAEAKAQEQYRHDRAADYFEYTKIKSSGHGSKFALHHDGTVLPGQGERNWLVDRGTASMPGEVAADERQKRETRREAAGRSRRRPRHL